MPNINMERIPAILEAATRLGVDQGLLNAPITLYRSGDTRRAALHSAGDAAGCGTGRDQTRREQLTFAELAGRHVCRCIWRHTGGVGTYAQLIEAIDALDNEHTNLGRTPDWSLWVRLRSLHRRYTTCATKFAGAVERGTRTPRTIGSVECGIHLECDPAITDRIERRATRIMADLDRHGVAWKHNSHATRLWWTEQLRCELDTTDTYAVVTLLHATAVSKVITRELGALCGYHYGIAHNERGAHDCYVVQAPEQILARISTHRACRVDPLREPVTANQAALLLELHDTDTAADELIDSVCAAVPA